MDLIKRMIGIIKKYGVEGSLITNGTIFDDELIEKIVLNRWDEVRISLHSPSPQLDHLLRRDKEAFKKSINFICKTFLHNQITNKCTET